jgi:hypothetical protein
VFNETPPSAAISSPGLARQLHPAGHERRPQGLRFAHRQAPAAGLDPVVRPQQLANMPCGADPVSPRGVSFLLCAQGDISILRRHHQCTPVGRNDAVRHADLRRNRADCTVCATTCQIRNKRPAVAPCQPDGDVRAHRAVASLVEHGLQDKARVAAEPSRDFVLVAAVAIRGRACARPIHGSA